MDIGFYIKLFLRRFHYFLIMVVLCSAAGFYLARALPTVFAADARLLVENEQIPGELAASTVRINPNEQLQIIRQRILTRDILIDMANRLDIYALRRARGEDPYDAEEIVEDLRDRIRIDLPRTSGRDNNATIVSIGFEAPTGQLAADVTNEMINLVLAEDVTMRTRTARQTLEFFEQQVTQLDRALAESSAEILAFKEANISALPDSLEFRRSQQAAAQERLLQVERQISEIRDRQERIAQILETNGALLDPGSADPETETAEEARLRALKAQRTSLLSILTPENPRMRLLEQQIAPLEEAVAAQRQMAVTGGDTTGTSDVLTPIEIQLLDLEGQLEFLESQRALVQDEIGRLTQSIADTPSNAVTLAALERNHASIAQQYDVAIANRAKAETGDTIEGLSKGQKITIIEPAIAPRTPASPNRPLVAAAGVSAGVILGLALVVLLEFLRPGIRRPVELTKGLGITAFATLPYLRSRREIVRRRLFVWGGVVLILGGVAAGIWLVDTYYMPIDKIVEIIQLRLR